MFTKKAVGYKLNMAAMNVRNVRNVIDPLNKLFHTNFYEYEQFYFQIWLHQSHQRGPKVAIIEANDTLKLNDNSSGDYYDTLVQIQYS